MELLELTEERDGWIAAAGGVGIVSAGYPSFFAGGGSCRIAFCGAARTGAGAQAGCCAGAAAAGGIYRSRRKAKWKCCLSLLISGAAAG